MQTDQPSNNVSVKKPNCISQNVWERFEALKKRTDDATKRPTAKRIKHFQKQILQTVECQMSSEEERAVLNKHGVDVTARSDDRPHDTSEAAAGMNTSTHMSCINTITNQSEQTAETTSPIRKHERFQEVEKYLGVNDHVYKGTGISAGPKSGLEKRIEEEITNKNVLKAEELSDQLSTRDYAVRINDAVVARDYLKRKKVEEETKLAKKKKLHWGFEHKQRWETKGNM